MTRTEDESGLLKIIRGPNGGKGYWTRYKYFDGRSWLSGQTFIFTIAPKGYIINSDGSISKKGKKEPERERFCPGTFTSHLSEALENKNS